MVKANALYFASEEDFATIGCFLERQQTNESLWKKQYLLTKRLVSRKPEQVASLKSESYKDESQGKKSPLHRLPLK